MPENHKETISLLNQKLDEVTNEELLCDKRIEKLVRDLGSAKIMRDEIKGKIKSLKQSISELKGLGKGKPKKEKS